MASHRPFGIRPEQRSSHRPLDEGGPAADLEDRHEDEAESESEPDGGNLDDVDDADNVDDVNADQMEVDMNAIASSDVPRADVTNGDEEM